MAQSNHERIGKALELLNDGLRPYLEREMRGIYGDRWVDEAQSGLREDRIPAKGKTKQPNWDTQALLAVMWERWNDVFGKTLGRAERSIVSELRETRNKWAHQETFSTDDAYRALDSIQRLLTAIAAEQAEDVDKQKQELLRTRFEEQTRREKKKTATVAIEGQPAAGLKPWREIVTPHPDVASGRYQQAEFAADLGQVHRGEGSDECKNPTEFFRRTFITDGLRQLLRDALLRLSGKGGNPVVELQTNFGGGKTHSMLALYHACSGKQAGELPGIDTVLAGTELKELSKANRAVLVGTAISPGQLHKKADGTVIHTLWGELAWQLLGKDGYKLVAEADKTGVSPGDSLREVLKKASPCLVLIDEWVAYARQLYGKDNLPAGTFAANLTFAQALTEAAKSVPSALVVLSLPASDVEIGGDAGIQTLAALKDTIGRIQSPWRPASSEESFEIVRRRLFHPITDAKLFTARDGVVRAFSDLYQDQQQEFPAGCREAEYERRMKAAYPIHPELFDRLYNDWSTLDNFQRTRGVLRLMAAVIHSLWERHDSSLMILPASIPIDEPSVQFELKQYLEDSWVPVIEKDIDGPHSLPLRLDQENPNLGRYSACRRVARTIYVGSAPTLHTANKGLEDRQIKLGCAQPGESVATFGDALRRLTDNATHLYVDGRRYWYSTQPSVARLAQDRAAQQDPDTVAEEIKSRLRDEQRSRGDFLRVHTSPETAADIPDEREARLVILGPDWPHTRSDQSSPAMKQAGVILGQRDAGPRRYPNTLVFLAADRTRLTELENAIRQYRAWKSIEDEHETLNLDAFQKKQSHTKREQAEETVRQRIPETFQWLLVPGQEDPKKASDDGRTPKLEWQEIRLQGQDPLAVRASKKLHNDELLITAFAPTRLRLELDRIPLWRGEHVEIKQLTEDFAQYLYLPRLRDTEVLLSAVREGVGLLSWATDGFAYAETFDSSTGRYRGLQAGQLASVHASGFIVKPTKATEQLEAEAAARAAVTGSAGTVTPTSGTSLTGATGLQPGGATKSGPQPIGDQPKKPTRFHGSVELDSGRVGRDAGKIAEEVLQHITALPGANVRVTLEIQAEVPSGIPENVARTVNENCRTLRFTSQGFEEE
jgi:predicted AAA+ superfamily ATPase